MSETDDHQLLAAFARAHSESAFAALVHFEETVSREEATAKAFNTLASAGKDDGLEAEFAKLSGHSVDDELAALKQERQSKISIPMSLPAPESRS